MRKATAATTFAIAAGALAAQLTTHLGASADLASAINAFVLAAIVWWLGRKPPSPPPSGPALVGIVLCVLALCGVVTLATGCGAARPVDVAPPPACVLHVEAPGVAAAVDVGGRAVALGAPDDAVTATCAVLRALGRVEAPPVTIWAE